MKRPSKREIALTLCRVSGYENNADWQRVYIEHRISYAAAAKAWREGAARRIAEAAR